MSDGNTFDLGITIVRDVYGNVIDTRLARAKQPKPSEPVLSIIRDCNGNVILSGIEAPEPEPVEPPNPLADVVRETIRQELRHV